MFFYFLTRALGPTDQQTDKAVMQKPLGIQKRDGPIDLPTYRRTRQGVKSRVRD